MKDRKIIAVVSRSISERIRIMSKLAVQLGFAQIPSDARKIIKDDIRSVDFSEAYFIFCSDYDFRGRSDTNFKLMALAAQGLCIMVGVPSLPDGFDFITRAVYPEIVR